MDKALRAVCLCSVNAFIDNQCDHKTIPLPEDMNRMQANRQKSIRGLKVPDEGVGIFGTIEVAQWRAVQFDPDHSWCSRCAYTSGGGTRACEPQPLSLSAIR